MSKLDTFYNRYLSDGVEYRKFGELATIVRGASPRPIKDFITEDPNGINWIKIGDVTPGSKYITSTEERITEEGAKKSRLVKEGDFVLSNSMSFGRPYILKTRGCIHDGWLAISDFEDVFIPDFLYHILNSNKYQQIMRQKAGAGGGVQNLNADIVRGIELPIVPIEVQEEIVRILDEYSEKKAQLIDALKAELEARKVQYAYYSKQLFTSYNHYPVNKLRDFVKVRMCKRIKKEQTNSDSGIPFYKNGTLGKQADAYIPEELYQEYRTRYAYPKVGEVMLSTAGTVGRTVQYDGMPAYFQDSNVVWLENNESVLSNDYLYWFCASMPWQPPSRATIKHLHNDMILDTEIVVPSFDDQKKLVLRYRSLSASFMELFDNISTEIQLRQTQYEYYRDKLLTFQEAN